MKKIDPMYLWEHRVLLMAEPLGLCVVFVQMVMSQILTSETHQ